MNHEIIRNLGKYLSVKDLKNARLVCRAWNNDLESTFKMRGRVLIDTRKQMRVKEFKKFVRAAGDRYKEKPFRNFIMEWGFNTKLLELCGKYINTLELRGSLFMSWIDFELVVLQHFVETKSLTFNDVYGTLFDKYDFKPMFPVNWKLNTIRVNGGNIGIPWPKLFRYFRNVRVLDVRANFPYKEYAITAHSQQEGGITPRIHLDKIYKLHFDPSAKTELKVVVATVRSTYCVRKLRRVLGHSAATLKELTLKHKFRYFLIMRENLTRGRTPLVALTSLTLCARVLPDLTFLKDMPNLQSFKLLYASSGTGCNIIGSTKGADLEKIQCVHCTHVEVKHPLSQFEIRKVGKLFPNMKSLKLHGMSREWINNLKLSKRARMFNYVQISYF